MRNALVAVAIVAFLSGCGGTSHPATSTTAAPKPTHAQLVAAARAKAAAAAAARQVAKAAAKARAEGYIVEPGALAGYKLLNTTLSHHGCGEFGNHGCWRMQIVTFKACPFFEMDINELRRGAVVETYCRQPSRRCAEQAAQRRVRRHRGQRDARHAGLHLQRERLTPNE